MKQIRIQVEDELHKSVKLAAVNAGVSLERFVREALGQAVSFGISGMKRALKRPAVDKSSLEHKPE